MISSLSWLTTGANSVLSPIIAAVLTLASVLGMDIHADDQDLNQAEQSAVDTTAAPAQGGTQKIPAGQQLTGGTLKEWDESVQTGPNSLRIEFQGADLSCTNYRAQVEETATNVRVDLYYDAVHPAVASQPRDDNDCVAVNRNYSIELDTDEPIGDRKIMQLF